MYLLTSRTTTHPRNEERVWKQNGRPHKQTMALYDNLFVFYDVETTSNEPLHDDVISLGAIVTRFDEQTRTFQRCGCSFHELCHTARPIQPGAEAVHHLGATDLCGKPRFNVVLESFRVFLTSFMATNSRTIFVAHNGRRFDDVVMFCTAFRNNIRYDDFLCAVQCVGFLDTLELLRTLFHGQPATLLPRHPSTHKISFALGCCHVAFTGNTITNAHDALADCEALCDVMNATSVCVQLTTVALFAAVVTVEKATKAIKRVAGSMFDTRCIKSITTTPTVLSEVVCLGCLQYVAHLPHLTCLMNTFTT